MLTATLTPVARPDGKPRALREFLTGASYLFCGFGNWRHAPGTMFLGWVPAFLVFAAFIAVVTVLGINLESIVTAITPFAETWDEPWQALVRLGIGLAVLFAAVFLGIFLFTTVTLIVGAWFYERVWASVESRFGPVPDRGMGFWRGILRDIGDALRMLVPTVLLGLAVFALNLIPLVGTVLSVVLGALAGGWMLTMDLTGFALGARRLSLRERRAAVRGSRAMTLGFGVATYLVFLVPGGTIIGMPAAVAGATLLARRITGESTTQAPASPPRTGP